MKTSAVRALRRKLAADQVAAGLWITLESPSITEMAVGLGVDWVVIDAEHGHLDWKEILEHVRATVRSDTVCLVRIAELNGALIKRVLDVGADGIVIPWMETAEQCRQAVAWARYPLEGLRGIGGERSTSWGQALAEHTREANEHVLVVPIIESVRARENAAEMCRVDGIEIFFFGPADYSSTAGYRGQWEGPGVAQQILEIKDLIRRVGKNCGLLATSHQNWQERNQQGFRMIGLGTDGGMLAGAIRSALSAAGRTASLNAGLTPPVSGGPLPRPPESMRPDRPEAMCLAGEGPKVEIAPGVEFECLVGAHNGARKLTTGLVRFQHGASLPCHTHTFSESITVLEGAAVVEVEGRTYTLNRMDNITLRPGLAHATRSAVLHHTLVLQISMATDAPSRTLIEKPFTTVRMPDDSSGVTGAERITRFATAPRSAAGPNTEFIDFFNDDLMPGLEMSGGYGLFHPGGRLPAHVHDFDESICIISGRATCVVEGRRYSLSECATALEPRGRVHYFINESNGPMEMLWVYAGPQPLRIVVDERCATPEGDPWK